MPVLLGKIKAPDNSRAYFYMTCMSLIDTSFPVTR